MDRSVCCYDVQDVNEDVLSSKEASYSGMITTYHTLPGGCFILYFYCLLLLIFIILVSLSLLLLLLFVLVVLQLLMVSSILLDPCRCWYVVATVVDGAH